MSTKHICRCDALLEDGSRCEKSIEIPEPYSLPDGWTRLHAHRPQTADDLLRRSGMGVMFDAITEEFGDDGKTQKMVERLKSAIVESGRQFNRGNAPRSAMVCPDHELPRVEWADPSPIVAC